MVTKLITVLNIETHLRSFPTNNPCEPLESTLTGLISSIGPVFTASCWLFLGVLVVVVFVILLVVMVVSGVKLLVVVMSLLMIVNMVFMNFLVIVVVE